MEESGVAQFRSTRLLSRKSGRRAPKSRDNNLDHEVAVLFGPGASPEQAIEALRSIIKSIKKGGLLIGREGRSGDFLFEDPDGKLHE